MIAALLGSLETVVGTKFRSNKVSESEGVGC